MTTEKKAWRKPTSITLPENLLMRVDTLAGPQGRSAFIQIALEHFIEALEQMPTEAQEIDVSGNGSEG